MRTTLTRLLGLAVVGVAVSADGASAQNRRPSVGVNFGNNGLGYNTQNGFGYGVNSPYYGQPGFNQPGYGQPGYNPAYGQQPYYGNNYRSAPGVVPGTSYYPPNQPYTQVPATTQYAPAPTMQPVVIPSQSAVVPASGTQPTTDTALMLTDVDAGGAQKAGLMKGDVILKVDNMRTKTFADLRNALTNAKSGTVKVDCFCKATGKRETKDVTVEDGRIGASVVETPVSMTSGS